MRQPTTATPVSIDQRSEILDILRGIALFGICIANYPVLAMYVFQKPEVLGAMPTAAIDKWLGYIKVAFVEGKFYSLFSLLFGIGFSIILLRNQQAGKNPLPVFYRRLFILMLIGLAHALLLWDGDILLLYALLGMLLPLFKKSSDKTLLILWMLLILSPLFFDLIKVITEGRWNFANPFKAKALSMDQHIGITENNIGGWLIVNNDYNDILKWNQSGFFWRWEMLLGTNRLPKVLGMFLLGLYVGRKMIYARLEENKSLLKKVQSWGIIIGLPTSLLHTYWELDHKGIPEPTGLLDTLSYALSVVPMSLFYATSLCLLYLKTRWRKRLMVLAPVGRMALTNYLTQTVLGIFIFYGIGLGLGVKTGLAYTMLISIGVFIFQIFLCHFWLQHFQYGPMEWIWRQLTYGKRLKFTKDSSNKKIVS